MKKIAIISAISSSLLLVGVIIYKKLFKKA